MNAENQTVIVGRADTFVKNEMARYVTLKEQLSMGDDIDTQTLLDTLEGETNLQEALAEVAKTALENEALADGLSGYIENLQQRKGRLKETAATLRNLIIMAMEKAGLTTVKQPGATLSVRATRPKLVVTDESLVPADYFKPADPVLDKEALKAAIESLEPGQTIPGAELSQGGVSLTIRVK